MCELGASGDARLAAAAHRWTNCAVSTSEAALPMCPRRFAQACDHQGKWPLRDRLPSLCVRSQARTSHHLPCVRRHACGCPQVLPDVIVPQLRLCKTTCTVNGAKQGLEQERTRSAMPRCFTRRRRRRHPRPPPLPLPQTAQLKTVRMKFGKRSDVTTGSLSWRQVIHVTQQALHMHPTPFGPHQPTSLHPTTHHTLGLRLCIRACINVHNIPRLVCKEVNTER